MANYTDKLHLVLPEPNDYVNIEDLNENFRKLDDADMGVSAKVPFAFGIDADGNYGYIKDGADTVTPFLTPPVLLWENPNPNVAFPAQTLQIDSTGYDYIMFVTRLSNTSTYLPHGIAMYAKNSSNLSCRLVNGGTTGHRNATVNDTTIAITNLYNGNTAATSNQTIACIPLYIFGWKTKVFDEYVLK